MCVATFPAPGRKVQVWLIGNPIPEIGEFLWNGFWLLLGGEVIGGGRVERWEEIQDAS
jgi:hypothetical protein